MQQPLSRLRNFLASDSRAAGSARGLLIFGSFLLLTLVMTWPWILHLRDAATDPGDPYLVSWILWWDYHQTFTDPLNLFHGNILYPYKYSLAFSEHHYGIALLFFPLFALGVRPLTIHGIATLIGFAFSGYGAFRLVRTLTGSAASAWISGIAFAFVPYRFGQMPHLVYLWSGWIPLVLEALVLFVRKPTWKRAIWLGIAFFFNALSAIHWFVMTLLPLALSAAVLLTRHSAWRKREIWVRGFASLGLAGLLLLPFLIPYVRAARLYGFVRSPIEAAKYSADVIDWLVPDFTNRFWHGLNATLRAGERQLFPGFLQPLLAAAAILLVDPGQRSERRSRTKKIMLQVLDFTLITTPILMITIAGYGFFKLRVFGHYLLEIRNFGPVLAVFLLALAIRFTIAYPHAFYRAGEQSFLGSLRTPLRGEGFIIGLIWLLTGFMGSLGMNFVFHRTLYTFVPLFWSIRVPARWAMICYLGLAILAGLGAMQVADLLRRHWPSFKPSLLVLVLAVALLIEQRAAPLNLIGGQVDPDALSLRLKQTPMVGGLVELPFKEGYQFPIYHKYSLRSTDHQKPLITAVSGFTPPIQVKIQAMTLAEPVPDAFFDLIESIPTSYVVLHDELLDSDRQRMHDLLRRGTANGRLRYINTFDGKSDLYAVIKIESNAKTEAQPPEYLVRENYASSDAPLDEVQSFVRMQYLDILGREPDPGGLGFWSEQIRRCGSSLSCAREARTSVSAALLSGDEFQQTATFVYNLYQRTLGRAPRYEEFVRDRQGLVAIQPLELAKKTFIEQWMERAEFTSRYSSAVTNEAFVDELLKVETLRPLSTDRDRLVSELNAEGSRPVLVRRLAEQRSSSLAEQHRAVITLAYFAYLRRAPTAEEAEAWIEKLSQQDPAKYDLLVESILESNEYRQRL